MSRKSTIATILIISGSVIAGGVLLWKCRGSEPEGDEEEYYGHSTYGSCQTDNDCFTGGCNDEICQSRNEEPEVSICTVPDKPTPGQLDYECRCVDDKCQWAQ